jgi:hypothetical protein
MNKKLQKVVDQYFEIYPEKEVLYFTEDGNCFLDKSPAKDHATKTKQKMFAIDNPDLQEYLNEKAELEAEKAKEVKLAEAEEKLLSFNFDESQYRERYDLATDLELALTDKKDETVTKALKSKLEDLKKEDE